MPRRAIASRRNGCRDGDAGLGWLSIMTRESGRWPEDGRRRVVVAAVRPSVDGGRHAVKRVTGETLRVEADLAIDGHDLLAARLHVRAAGDARWIELPMQPAGPERRDTWVGEVVLDRIGTWQYRVEAWVDGVATWRHGLEKKTAAG